MRKILLIVHLLLIFISVCASCQNDEKVIFQESTPGLQKIGLEKQINRYIKFYYDGSKVFYCNYANDETADKIYEYDLEKGTKRLIFASKEHYYFDGLDSAFIENIFVINKENLFVLCRLYYQNQEKRLTSLYKEVLLNLNPDGTVAIVEDRDGDDYGSALIQSSVDRSTAIAHAVIWGNSFLVYKLESAMGKIVKTPYQNYGMNYCSGKEIDEVIVCDETEKGKLFLHFFDTKTQKDRKTIQVPDNVIKDVHGNYFDGILLSPDGKYLALDNAAFGVWIFDTTTDKFFNLLYTYDAEKGSHRDVYVYDWSWDSRNIVFRISQQVYIMDLYKFMESRK